MEVYTDGSCLGNPGPGGWAVIGPGFELSGSQENTTNNIMELTAALKCLEHTGTRDITIFTDSCYLKNGITKWVLNWKKNGWKTSGGQPVKNKEIWIEIDKLNGPHVQWQWVKAHSGHPFNDAADRLAQKMAREICSNIKK